MNQLLIISPGFGGEHNSGKLINSCNHYGYELAFYSKVDWFRDFRQVKINRLLEFLYTVKHKYVCFTDAWDSWFLRADLLKVYKRYFNGQVVVAGNRDYYPGSEYIDIYPAAPTSFRFICSSQFMGETKKVIGVIEAIKRKYSGNIDQEGWNDLYVFNNSPHLSTKQFVIDYECRLFLTMVNVLPEEVDTKVWKLKETKTRPCSIHFSGGKGSSPNGRLMEEFYQLWQNNPQ
jgi:hypothetical protein